MKGVDPISLVHPLKALSLINLVPSLGQLSLQACVVLLKWSKYLHDQFLEENWEDGFLCFDKWSMYIVLLSKGKEVKLNKPMSCQLSGFICFWVTITVFNSKKRLILDQLKIFHKSQIKERCYRGEFDVQLAQFITIWLFDR
jgi:hypothetical protein